MTSRRSPTHWLLLSQHAENKYRFEDEERDQKHQGRELIQDVETNIPMGTCQTAIEMIGIAECCVERYVPGTDEEGRG